MRMPVAMTDNVRQTANMTWISVFKLLGLTKFGCTPGGGAIAGMSSGPESLIDVDVISFTDLRVIDTVMIYERKSQIHQKRTV